MTDSLNIKQSDPGNSVIQILVPIYNEGKNVDVLYTNLIKENVDFDRLIFVHDLYNDTSLPYIRTIAKRDPRVIADKNNFGTGVINALRWGFLRCCPGPVIVLMGDNSDKLSLIPKMVQLWQTGVTIVAPSRYMRGGKQHGGELLKKTMSRLAGVSLKFFGFPITDPTNNFKLYDGEWVRDQHIESTGGFEIALELCYKAYMQNRSVLEIPTEWYDRESGESRFDTKRWLPRYLKWYTMALCKTIGREVAGNFVKNRNCSI